MKRQFWLGLLACAVLALIPAAAQKQSADRLEKADDTWAQKVAEGGMGEVKLGQLAVTRGSSQEVKDFGQRMVDDHSKANDELKQIASKKGITLPADLDPKDQATYDNLSKLSGADFDRAYLAAMVKDHRADIEEFKREAAHGTDSDLKNFAAKTLPMIEHHLEMAEKAQSRVSK